MDTKHVSEGQHDISATFLEYLYRKSERTFRGAVNLTFPPPPPGCELAVAASADGPHVRTSVGSSHAHAAGCAFKTAVGVGTTLDAAGVAGCGEVTVVEVCKAFRAVGACRKGASCPHSHSVDDILDAEEALESSKRKRKRDGAVNDDGNAGDGKRHAANVLSSASSARSEGHRAGFDSYMTA